MAKKAKKTNKLDVGRARAWRFYLSNGELFATLTYSLIEINELFPSAVVSAGNVHLA